MGERDVTELVIDADTGGADRYSQAMDRVASSSAEGMSSATGVALAIAGVGVAVVGAVAGLRGFYDYVGGQSKLLVDMANNAELAGMSTREFQETLFAARASGLTEKDFVSGLDRITADLTAAGRGVTDFGKLFEQNGLSIRNASGDIKSAKEAVGDLAKMMQNASPQVQQGIARIVGVSKDWIPFLKQGADAIEETKRSAASLGVIIGDDVIEQAKAFDREWRMAVATWDLQFKASMNSILPMLVQLAGLAAKVIEGIGSVSSDVMRWMTPDDQKTKAQLDGQINQVMQLRDMMEGANNEFMQFRTRNLKGALGLPEDADLKAVDAYVEKLRGLYNAKPAQVVISRGTTELPPSGGQKDSLEKEIDTIEKHIARFQADAEAVGQNVGVREQLRAEAALYAAAERAGIKDTEQYAEKFYNLSLRVGEAAQALEKAKVANNIKFGRDTGFLSQQDLQIAQQLKGIYPDVATALGSVEAQGIRTNNAMRELASGFESTVSTGLTDIAMGTKTAEQGFADMGLAFARMVEQMIIKIMVVEPLLRALQSGLSGLGLGAFGGGAAQGPMPDGSVIASAHGNVFGSGNVIPFARGGIVDSNRVVPMARMGEAGPEAIVPLRRGSDGNLGIASAGGGTQVNVSVMNYGNDNVSVNQTPNQNGGIDFELVIGQATAKQMANRGSALRQVTDQRGRIASGR
jgi:lambda family phage tail tape measure protein